MHHSSPLKGHFLPTDSAGDPELEFRRRSTCQSEDLTRTSALDAARRSETELIETIVTSA